MGAMHMPFVLQAIIAFLIYLLPAACAIRIDNTLNEWKEQNVWVRQAVVKWSKERIFKLWSSFI